MNRRKSHRWCVPLVVAAFCVVIASSPTLAGDVSIDGYLKSYASMFEFPSFSFGRFSVNPPPVGAVSNRLRLEARWPVNRWLTANAAYDLDARIQDHSLFGTDAITATVSQSYRLDDFDSRLYPGTHDSVASFGLFENLDRAQVELRVSRLDLYVGRQAIAWGTAHVINPTDILTAFSYTALDTEDRVGVDAIRARVATGPLSELDMGVVAGKDLKSKNSAAFVRYRAYVVETDLTVIMVGFRENLLAGFDMTRSIGGAGSWLEAAYVWPQLLQPRDDLRPDNYWRVSVGADYNFGANTYTFIEYHYNQPGQSNSRDYASLASTVPYVDGAVYLLGKHYLAPGVSRQITPLVTATAQVLWNLSDASSYFSASLEYNLSENVYLAGGTYIGVGPGLAGPTERKSEFGSYPDIFYTSFRYYF